MTEVNEHEDKTAEEDEYKECDEGNIHNNEDAVPSEVKDEVTVTAKVEISAEDAMEDIPVNEDSNNHGSSEDRTNGVSGNVVMNKNVELSVKVQSFKDWGYNTFMRTKQKMKEKLSRTSRTVDLDLEDRIDVIKLQQTQYKMMLSNNNRMVEQLRQNIIIHQYSARMFAELAQTDKVLSELFLSQSQSEMSASVQFKDLIDKLIVSTKTLETLVTKTFDDMLLGIQAFETARVEYDAFKTETVKLLTQIQQKNSSNNNDQIKLQEMQERLEQKREKYESSKGSVLIKLDLLEDNKIRVIQREILNFKHAWFTLHSNCLELYSGSHKHISMSVSSDKSEPGTEDHIEHHE